MISKGRQVADHLINLRAGNLAELPQQLAKVNLAWKGTTLHEQAREVDTPHLVETALGPAVAGVLTRGADVGVPHDLLQSAEIAARVQEVIGEGRSEPVRIEPRHS